jgi:GGDEF domain-containing protein
VAGEVDGSADFDRLIGLPNAEKFLADAAAAIAAGGNNQSAMLCVDVDFFSGTPDHLANQTNHQAGDLREVLRLTIARRVRRRVAPGNYARAHRTQPVRCVHNWRK